MHRCDFRLPVRVLAAAALPLMGAVTLAGCSGASQHQVIDRNVACSSCHSDEKPAYEGATVPSETVESGSRHREPRLPSSRDPCSLPRTARVSCL